MSGSRYVAKFVEYVRVLLDDDEFYKVAKMAASGKMGFGSDPTRWGRKEKRGVKF